LVAAALKVGLLVQQEVRGLDRYFHQFQQPVAVVVAVFLLLLEMVVLAVGQAFHQLTLPGLEFQVKVLVEAQDSTAVLLLEAGAGVLVVLALLPRITLRAMVDREQLIHLALA
jgi:uncharacterized metal-binding protein